MRQFVRDEDDGGGVSELFVVVVRKGKRVSMVTK